MMNKHDLRYFSQICTEELIALPSRHPDIGQVISSVADHEIISLKVVNTMKGTSYEGQTLSGKVLVVEFKLRHKILYISEKDTQSVHIIENELFKNAYIVIPCLIEGTDPAILINHKLLQCKIYVEDIFVRKVDKRKIFKNICLNVSAEVSPVCEIGYAMHDICKNSDIYMMHSDGTHTVKITESDNYKNYKPVWSPSGSEIAYITDWNNSKIINLYSFKTCSGRQLSRSSVLKSIGSYCWSANGTKLFISGCLEGKRKEIYTICSNDTDFKQLTIGNGMFDSYIPKVSPSGNKIAFLRSFNGLTDLWIMNYDGMDCIKITTYGSVKCFDWSPDGKTIIYVYSCDCKPYQICLYDIDCKKNAELYIELKSVIKRRIQFSPDGTCFAFIGTHYDLEDIFVYNISEKKLMNVTSNCDNIKINDFVWSADSDKVCYTANELFYYNIYSVTVEDKFKRQLTNNTASKIELSYRPKIG